MERHQDHIITAFLEAVNICNQSNLLQKTAEARRLLCLLVGNRLAEQFVNIFYARPGFLCILCLKFLYIACPLYDLLQYLGNGQVAQLAAHGLYKIHKRLHFPPCLPDGLDFLHLAQGIVKAYPLFLCISLHPPYGGGPNPALGDIDNPAHGQVVAAIVNGL